MYGYNRDQCAPNQSSPYRYPKPDPCWCYEGPMGPTGPTGPAGGLQNLVDGNASGAVRGINTPDDYTMGENAFAIGTGSIASGDNAVAQGVRAIASGGVSHAEGYDTQSTAFAAHAEGNASIASGDAAHAEGGSTASGFFSHSEGLQTIAQGEGAHAEGGRSTASGNTTHAEGFGTTASGLNAHAEGRFTTASENNSHAEGESSLASGYASHAEGYGSKALGFVSHTEGYGTEAASYSHTEGFETRAAGSACHNEGYRTLTQGFFSHAEGVGTSGGNHDGVHIMGRYGTADTPYSWFLANGTSEMNQGLSAKILRDGNAYIDVAWNGGGADYAELYETSSGQPLEPGYFVTFDGAGKKIRTAQSYDKYILGVVSRAPGFVAGAGELRWKNKYKTDAWGGIVYEDVAIAEKRDDKGNVLMPAHTESQPVLNPAYDSSRTYVPRQNRPEWVKVGLLGMLPVRDDGTLTPGGYCLPGMNGVATAAHEGYRVLERTGPNQVLILFR